MKKRLSVSSIISLVVVLCVAGIALAHEHTYGAWTWTPKMESTCMKIGQQERKCTSCGYHDFRKVAKAPHDYKPATCTVPATCRFGCGNTSGTPLGHSYRAATCVAKETCVRCNATRGSLGSHKFAPATCQKLSTCTVCGLTTGSLGGHTYRPANCIEPRTCTLCGDTRGAALGHNWNGNVCTRCRMSYAVKYDPAVEY